MMNGFTEPWSMKRKAARKSGKKPSAGGGKKPGAAGRGRSQGAGKGRPKGGSSAGASKPGGRRPARRKKPERGPSADFKARPRKKAADSRERLQKVLAAAGLGSRRQCEELILTGRVEVDRDVVMELGTRVDPEKQRIRVDGVELRKPKTVWYALNKPIGVVCTNRDPSGRPRAIDLVAESRERLFPVGRLDMNSEGLLLLTNDGELANQLAHPRYGITKTYRVLVAGQPGREVMTQLRRGVYLSEGLTRITGVTIKRRYKKSTILEMVLQEGKNREIRRVLARVGHKVMRLVRIATGPVKLGELEPGDSRRLTRQEVEALRRSVREGKQ
jgi:23S rRNA pseudouridine2605 synthase